MALTKREKRLKREAKMERKAQQSNSLLAYLGNYGEPDDIQTASAAAFDTQIKNLSLPLATRIAATSTGTVLDIGCGEGILLNRLTEIDSFKTNGKWIYFGVDFIENIKQVMLLAVNNQIHRRADTCTFDEFFSDWPPIDRMPRPYILVVRNVFHELNIDQTARLLQHIAQHLDQNDLLIVQDIQVFPVSERGNACWLPNHFNDLLSSIGFDTTFVEEPTAKGNRWFTITSTKRNDNYLELNAVRAAIISERKKQYDYWVDLGWLNPDDEKYREVRLAKLDFDLQCAALQQQLLKAHVGAVPPPTPQQQSRIIKMTFAKHLAGFQLSALPTPTTSLIQTNPFRDRAQYQDLLETFLLGNTTVAIIAGGAFAGKTALIKEVLSRRAYDKQVVMLDVQITSSIWNLIEQLLLGIGCKFESEIFSSLKNVSFNDIKNEIGQFICGICGSVIISIDHFERLLDPRDEVQDTEIRDFLALIANEPHSKLIITTRRSPNLGFIQSARIFQDYIAPMGRFPEGDHVENVLNDFVNRAQLGIDIYPDQLFKAIDRHPFLTVLAGMTIRKEGKSCLLDTDFMHKLQQNMREALLRNLVDDVSKSTIEVLSLLRIPVPRQMLESLAGVSSVRAAEEAGLVYGVFDRVRNDLVTGLGVIRRFVGVVDDFDSDHDLIATNKDEEFACEHTRIAAMYEQLYRTNYDPRWVRELHYHRLAAGPMGDIDEFGVLYRDEIYWAGDFWFRQHKNYKAALWAFEAAKKLGLTNVHAEMRRASCMMRLNNPKGDILFTELIAQYPNARNIKTSYIDSLLYLDQHKTALAKLIEYGLKEQDDAWIAHEYGRAYFGLLQFQQAVSAFEIQLKLEREPAPLVYDSLARAYQRIGEAEHEARILVTGLRQHKNSGRLKLRYAAFLIRKGIPKTFQEADEILKDLVSSHPTDGRILQQYCKLLCLTERVSKAEEIWKNTWDKIYPVEYRIPIHVEILIQNKKWDDAIGLFRHSSQNSDIHLVGLHKEVYLAWAKTETDELLQRDIAARGLAVKTNPAFDTNIPHLITSARLARLAGKDELNKILVSKARKINEKLGELLEHDQVNVLVWEDDIVPL